jgi:4-hydroxyphenylacetate 3-monooxygenase
MTTNQSHASGQKTLDTTVTVAEEMSTPASTMSASHRPKTREEYIESIRDGREIYLHGDRVKDVTTHPAR